MLKTNDQPFLSTDRRGMLHLGGTRLALLDIETSLWGLRRQMEALVGLQLSDALWQQAGVNGGISLAEAFIDPDSVPDERDFRNCIIAFEAIGFGQFEIVKLEWPIGRVLIRGRDAIEAWMMRRHEQQAGDPVCAYTSGMLVGFANALSGRRDVVCVKRACQGKGEDACLFELLPADQVADSPIITFDPDPFLSHQLNLLELLFDRMPMGIAIFDRDLLLRRYNPTWAGFIDRYTRSTRSQVLPGIHFYELAPGIEATMMPIVERVLNGETIRREALCLESGGIKSFWDAVFAPLYEKDRVVGLMDVMNDVTERVLAYQTLEQRVEERTREIERKRQADILEERNRLARELHDAVTQSIFSATLIADVLPRLWESNPDQVRQSLDDLRSLTRGALAEMRTLLLELRPAALARSELNDLLRQLTEAIAGRTGLPIDLKIEVEGTCSLPPDVRVALYRIAQEALNNVAKHSGAGRVDVYLSCSEGRARLLIGDDGRGFEIEKVSPKHLGVGIMRERAIDIGAQLHLESEIGVGTRVLVTWSAEG